MARNTNRRRPGLRREDFESNDRISTAPDAHEAGDVNANRPIDQEDNGEHEPEHTEAAPGMDLGISKSGMATEILQQIQSMPKEDVARLHAMLMSEEEGDEKRGDDDLFDKDSEEPVDDDDKDEDEEDDEKEHHDESYLGEDEDPDKEDDGEPDGDEGDDADDEDKKDADDEDGVEINIGDVKKEDLKFKVRVDKLFEGQNLSAKFVKRATEIFEAAVLANTNRNVQIVQEMANRELRIAAKKQKARLTEQANRYLTHVAQEFMRENHLPIENNLKAEAFDSLVGGLGKLMTEHYLRIPAGKENLVEKLVSRVEKLEGALNEQVKANMLMSEDLEALGREHALIEACDGLSRNAADKLRTLSEGFDYVDHDEFVNKLTETRNNFLSEGRPASQGRSVAARQLTEDTTGEGKLALAEDTQLGVVDVVADHLNRHVGLK